MTKPEVDEMMEHTRNFLDAALDQLCISKAIHRSDIEGAAFSDIRKVRRLSEQLFWAIADILDARDEIPNPPRPVEGLTDPALRKPDGWPPLLFDDNIDELHRSLDPIRQPPIRIEI